MLDVGRILKHSFGRNSIGIIATIRNIACPSMAMEMSVFLNADLYCLKPFVILAD